MNCDCFITSYRAISFPCRLQLCLLFQNNQIHVHTTDKKSDIAFRTRENLADLLNGSLFTHQRDEASN